jgi:hypothetical protein
MQEQQEEDFVDIMNVRQGILFELYDFDRASKDSCRGSVPSCPA